MSSPGGCSACGADAPLRCGACGAARYCTPVCQRKHWPQHRDACRAAKAAASSGAGLPAAPAALPSPAPPPAAAAALPPSEDWGALAPGDPLGRHVPPARRRAWEACEVGRHAPALLAAAPSLQSMVEALPGAPVRHAAVPGKGRGLLARRAFAPGETILAEAAVAYFPHWGIAESEGPADILRVPSPAHRAPGALEGLLLQLAPFMADTPAAAAGVAGDPGLASLTRSQLVSSVALESAFGVRVEGARTWAAGPSASRLGDGGEPADGPRTIDALCPVASLCNHDCAPNAAWVAHGPRTLEGGAVGVRLVAQRPIPAGGEVTIAYKPSTTSPRPDRARLLREQYGFHCVCGRCTGDSDDTVAFRCAGCGGGPVRLREVRAGGGSGVVARTAACASCGAAQTTQLAAAAAAAAGVGEAATSSVIAPAAFSRLLATRAAVASAPLAALATPGGGCAVPLHDADVALFEARFNALAALLSAPRGAAVGDGGAALFQRDAAALAGLAAGVLGFLPHAGHYLELFKRKRVLRDAALALCAAEACEAGRQAGGSGAAADPAALLAEAAELEAAETGPTSRRSALLRELASAPPPPHAVPAAYDALTTGPL